MAEKNKNVMNDSTRRWFAALFFVALCIGSWTFGKKDLMGIRIVPEKMKNSVNLVNLANEFGYPLRTNIREDGDVQEKKLQLYAKAAVLLDADSKRVLYGKNEDAELPMASTTKIMTCIVALENGRPEDIVTVSSQAASQPEVRLGIRKGEQYILRDLIYAMMLTSYNDCAVAIAEHIGGSAEGFANMMNEKARELGCYATWFITANGLDAENEGGVHRTTAKELARILAYAIENPEFLVITQANSHSFTDVSKKRNFSVVNKNSFLSMMDGVLSGKTGYTNDAGYCYTAALSKDGKTLVSVVLGSGWPPHKTRKWTDTKKLMNYGLENYSQTTIKAQGNISPLKLAVKNGTVSMASVDLSLVERNMLMREGEVISMTIDLPTDITAPMNKGTIIGAVTLYLGDEPVLMIPAVLSENLEAFTFMHCFEHIFAYYFDISS